MRNAWTGRARWAAVALGLALTWPAAAPGGQEEQFTPEFREIHRTYDAKHTPKIVAPESVKRGQLAWGPETADVRPMS